MKIEIPSLPDFILYIFAEGYQPDAT